VVKSHGFAADRTRDQDLNAFPIEEARLKVTAYPLMLCSMAIVAYGWTLQKHLASVSRDGEDKDLTPTAYFGPLNPTIYNRS
jgi:hypothetical protein